MRTSWTRERIIRHILEREAGQLPLTTGPAGVDPQVHSAARRIFGSWRNAVLAAGISPERVRSIDHWSPARILANIRLLSRRRKPLTAERLERRDRHLVFAARRHFGSWSKAVVAAGVNPAKLQRVVRWSRERVMEAILTRALRADSLVAREVEPRSLAVAGKRFFGSWRAAVEAAGVDARVTEGPSRDAKRPRQVKARESPCTVGHGGRAPWSKQRVVDGIRARHREHRPLNAWAVSRDQPTLYGAAQRHLNSWDDAIRAAGLDPNQHRRDRGGSGAARPRVPAARKSQGNGSLRPDQSG